MGGGGGICLICPCVKGVLRSPEPLSWTQPRVRAHGCTLETNARAFGSNWSVTVAQPAYACTRAPRTRAQALIDSYPHKKTHNTTQPDTHLRLLHATRADEPDQHLWTCRFRSERAQMWHKEVQSGARQPVAPRLNTSARSTKENTKHAKATQTQLLHEPVFIVSARALFTACWEGWEGCRKEGWGQDALATPADSRLDLRTPSTTR